MNDSIDMGRRALRALTERGLLERWSGMYVVSGDKPWQRWRLNGRRWVSDEGDFGYSDGGSMPCARLGITLTDGWVDVDDAASQGVLLAAARLLWGAPRIFARPYVSDMGGDVWMVVGPSGGHVSSGESEAGAIVAAIESAPVQP